MRTVFIVAAGLMLGLVMLSLWRRRPSELRLRQQLFYALWALLCAGNMAMGVLQAGYGLWEEVPFFLLNFCIPAVAVALYGRHLRRRSA